MHQHEVGILFEKLDIANALLTEIAQNTRPRYPETPPAAAVVRSLPRSSRTGIPGGPPQFGAPRTAPEGEGDWVLVDDDKIGLDV